jgi:SAM-dependent methyltransferase
MSELSDKLEQIASIYDAAADYDGVLTVHAWELLRPRIPAGAHVLEMGCSSGVMTRYLAKHAGRLRVVDGSRTYLEDVRAKLAADGTDEKVRLDHALFEDYAPEERFDAIVMARAVEHLAEPGPVLRKVAGWLGPDGELHVMVPNAWSFHRLIGVAMGLLPEPHALNERDRAYGHHRVYDPVTLRAELEAAGLEVVEEAGSSLKFLANAQMHALDAKLWDAFEKVGRQFPAHGAEIYARCRVRR